MKAERETLREAIAERQNGQHEPNAIAVVDREERANEGSPQLTKWCPTCEERAVPMRDGTCGFCETPLVDLEPDDTRQDHPPDEWPHTEGVVRRQVVNDEPAEQGKLKRRRAGHRSTKPILTPPPSDEERRLAREMDAAASTRDPRRSPILDWLTEHGTGTAPRSRACLSGRP